jgi:cobalt-zinc-cadmium efflux system outer membrane protein
VRAQWVRLGASGMLAAGLLSCVPAFAQSADRPLGATVDDLLAAGRQLSPDLRAAALDTTASAATASGADALDDPTISDGYQYYKDPGVFSGHSVMLTQAFPLWGKRDLRRQAALADVDAARGKERAAQDALAEKIKLAYAQYYLISRDIAVNREIDGLARRMRAAASVRYGQGGGDQTAVIQALGEQTSAKTEVVRLEGEKGAVRARLNTLVGRPADASLVEPMRVRPMPVKEPDLVTLVDRARVANPALSSSYAEIDAARTRKTLADKAWYPDVTVGAGPLIQTNNRPVGFAATIGFNVPLSWGRESSEQQTAVAQLGATQQRYDAALLEIEGALGEALAKLHAARTTETLLSQEVMPQARATYRTVLADYSQGKGELTAAIAAEHQMHDVELTLLQTQLDEQVELAAIERLIGGDL